MLVRQLPHDSALNRELHGEAADWSVTDHLLAAAVDHLAAANWMFASVNSEEGDQPDPPAPVPRPSYDDDTDTGGGETPGGASPEETAAADTHTHTHTDAAPSTVQLARFFG